MQYSTNELVNAGLLRGLFTKKGNKATLLRRRPICCRGIKRTCVTAALLVGIYLHYALPHRQTDMGTKLQNAFFFSFTSLSFQITYIIVFCIAWGTVQKYDRIDDPNSGECMPILRCLEIRQA
eukprot:2615229-Amphidinium_carterae.1